MYELTLWQVRDAVLNTLSESFPNNDLARRQYSWPLQRLYILVTPRHGVYCLPVYTANMLLPMEYDQSK